MKLTRFEEDMLAGKEGKGTQVAMEIIVRLGELYGASELIPVSQAHIDGCLYAAVGEAGLIFAEKLQSLDAKVRVPTTLNATSRDIDDWQEHGVDPEFAEKNTRMESAYLAMGAIPVWTCAPYQAGLIPRFGEQIAWAESNAILYANSVIGARTERYGDYTDICCAITGRVPFFGLHKSENRAGQVLVDCSSISFENSADYFAVLGYLIGDLVKDKIPVIKGLPQWVTGDHLKSFCAAAASSGAVALFHMVGITPEAPDEQTAFQGRKPGEEIEITGEMISKSREQLSSGQGGHVDAVLIGCPHASVPEIMQIAAMLRDKKLRGDRELWIYTSRAVNHWLTVSGVVPELKAKGVKIIKDTCFINTDLRMWNFATVMTNSAKYAHYMTGRTGLKAVFAGLDECMHAVYKESEKPGV
ncbi:MAG: aconitase X catalytic domain-containing protein [Clostridiales bacterium]|jgi:predicted aconitase|nr:aconitase X catalytic domain-containing protein [Clostridiales bacterium]